MHYEDVDGKMDWDWEVGLRVGEHAWQDKYKHFHFLLCTKCFNIIYNICVSTNSIVYSWQLIYTISLRMYVLSLFFNSTTLSEDKIHKSLLDKLYIWVSFSLIMDYFFIVH